VPNLFTWATAILKIQFLLTYLRKEFIGIKSFANLHGLERSLGDEKRVDFNGKGCRFPVVEKTGKRRGE